MRDYRRSVVWLVVIVTALCGISIGGKLLFSKLQRQQSLSRQMRAFRDILVGLYNYDGVHGQVPTPVSRDRFGRPRASWRFQVLVFLEQLHASVELDKSWCDPRNHYWATPSYPLFCSSRNENEPLCHTGANISAITGANTPLDDGHLHKMSELPPQVIVIIEVRTMSNHWAEPGDLSIDALPADLTEGTDGTGCVVGFADGEVWFLDRSVSLDSLTTFFAVNTAASADRESVLGPYCKKRFRR